jgi:hypothetical protein
MRSKIAAFSQNEEHRRISDLRLWHTLLLIIATGSETIAKFSHAASFTRLHIVISKADGDRRLYE